MQIILFNGGNNLSEDWKKMQGRESNLINELQKLTDSIFTYDPPFYFNDQIIQEFKNSQKDQMFLLRDLDLEVHCKDVYKKINHDKNDKILIISWSRGYMYGNVFAHLFSDQIIGYINIDGGKPDEEYEHILETTKSDIHELTNSDSLEQYFKKIKATSDETELKELRRSLSKFVTRTQFSQYKKTNQKLRVPVYILNNIYNDQEINISDTNYVSHALKWKLDYNDYAQKNYGAKSIWYVGKKHWLYTFEDVVKDIIRIINEMIDSCSSEEKEKEIYIVRHGETSWNQMGLTQGSENDIELNDHGIDQAMKCGEYLKNQRINGKEFDLIVSSPLKRAIHTAQIIAKTIDYDVNKIILSNDLIETSMGLLAIGKTVKELKSDPFYDEFFKLMDEYHAMDELAKLDTKEQVPEIFIIKYKMESNQSIRKRINEFLQFLKLTPCKKILVVTHADTIRSMNSMIMNSVFEIKGDLTAGKNCHLTYYKLKDGKFKLIMAPSTFYLTNS